MKSFFDFLTRKRIREIDQWPGLSLDLFTHSGPPFFFLLSAIVILLALLLIGFMRPQTPFLRNAYILCATIPIMWGIYMTVRGVFGVLDILARGGGKWQSGMGQLQPLQDVLSAVIVHLLTGCALTAIFLLCVCFFPKRRHENVA